MHELLLDSHRELPTGAEGNLTVLLLMIQLLRRGKTEAGSTFRLFVINLEKVGDRHM